MGTNFDICKSTYFRKLRFAAKHD